MKAPPPYEPASHDERAALAPALGDPRTWPAASWPDPQPLPEGLAPVAAFDYAMLPDRLRPWVQDVADRMQCPPDFVAVPMVAARPKRLIVLRPGCVPVAEFVVSEARGLEVQP